jgi:CRP-like cAMP-binding protein
MLRKFFSSTQQSSRKKESSVDVERLLLSKFRFLDGAEYGLISELATLVETVSFPEGDTIFREGELGHSFFLVVEGSVSISSKGEFLAQLGEGGCFGEGALLSDEVRGATAKASEDATLFELRKESFAELKDKYLKVRFRINELHGQRIAEGIKTSIERNLIEKAPFISSADSDLVSELAQIMERKKFAQGETLIQEGQQGTTFYIVEEGLVGIIKEGEQVAQLGPGACIGEGSLLSSNPCSATVTTLTDTSCFILRRSTFRNILFRYPVFAKKLQRIHEERSRPPE